ncbi:hypothetical protein SODALDRAFT_356972 [Sodiomyces alkalinus F11]|uniref:Uncharacterized protein n=1 Tax=Sodiomyces alkalinus (strain CBS 110278 / VKM F-3762 / F11) TaxID=1314773 RepID=A0A3N2Q2H0_SODAK|nr:hypothetical protein SODALDRAFT_356972 [Sodiomyces alkalinus F11]ROT40950.1 hypothetical protein SODALDRAFT_356972 [Sodiomyces alkalinus F11]
MYMAFLDPPSSVLLPHIMFRGPESEANEAAPPPFERADRIRVIELHKVDRFQVELPECRQNSTIYTDYRSIRNNAVVRFLAAAPDEGKPQTLEAESDPPSSRRSTSDRVLQRSDDLVVVSASYPTLSYPEAPQTTEPHHPNFEILSRSSASAFHLSMPMLQCFDRCLDPRRVLGTNTNRVE